MGIMFIVSRFIGLGLIVALISGCVSTNCCVSFNNESEESIHYLIIGFGVVTVPKHKQPDAVTATKLNALGVTVSDQPGLKFGVGYTSSMVVAVPDGAEDVRVEVGNCSGGGLRVTTQRALLKDSITKEQED